MRSFRLLTDLTEWEADHGSALWRPADPTAGAKRPPTVPGTLLLEALVQCAGLLLQRTDLDPTVFWMLAGVDDAEAGVVDWHDVVSVDCIIRQRSHGAAIVDANAIARDRVVCRASLMMVHAAL